MLNEIERVKNDVEFTDSYTNAKFDMASEYITDIKNKNEFSELIEVKENGGSDRDKKQVTKSLNNNKEEIYIMFKKVQNSLKDIPLVDINERFEL